MRLYRVFLAHVIANYLLMGSRMIGVFVLRLIADPFTVGVINVIQVFNPIFSALTAGGFYSAIRRLPTCESDQRSQITWSAFYANLFEAVVVVIPFLLVFIALSKIANGVSVALLAIVGLFWISQRLFGLLESVFMSLSMAKFVVALKLSHILELTIALSVLGALGPLGYLSVSVVFCVASIYCAHRLLPLFGLTVESVKQSLVPNSYSSSLGLEKLVSAIASTLDSVLVAVVAGPVAIAGYYLGVSIRGACCSIINSLYWAVWPTAVRELESTGRSVFSDRSYGVAFLMGVLLFSYSATHVVEYIIAQHLKDYSTYLPTIHILIYSMVPFALAELKRAELVVEKHTRLLPIMTIFKIVIFVLSLLIFNFFQNSVEMLSIAFSSFACIFANSLMMHVVRHKAGHVDCIIKHCIALVPIIIFVMNI